MNLLWPPQEAGNPQDDLSLSVCPFLWAPLQLRDPMTDVIGSCKESHHKINELQQFIPSAAFFLLIY